MAFQTLTFFEKLNFADDAIHLFVQATYVVAAFLAGISITKPYGLKLRMSDIRCGNNGGFLIRSTYI